MRIRTEQKIAIDSIKHFKLSDEEIFRDLAKAVIDEMSYDELQKFMRLRKVDPFSEDSAKALSLKNLNTPDYERRIIEHLACDNAVLFEVECETDKTVIIEAYTKYSSHTGNFACLLIDKHIANFLKRYDKNN